MQDTSNDFLSSIKKIHTVETGYGKYHNSDYVNKLLAEGWVILEIQKNEYGEPKKTNEKVVYHLGHTNPNADTHEQRF